MKKMKRMVALFLAGTLCLCLSGCNALDKARAAHGFWQEEGESILWNGEVYRKIAETDTDINLSADEQDPIYITEPEVPVLLREGFGVPFDSCQDGVFLRGWYDAIYCRVDKYDEMAARIAEGYELEEMNYTYDDVDKDGKYVSSTYTLSAEEMQTVLDLYSTLLPATIQDGMYFSSDYTITICGCTSDQLFQRALFDIELAGETYYIVDDEGMYQIPTAYKAVFDGILKAELDARKRIEERWENEWLEDGWVEDPDAA